MPPGKAALETFKFPEPKAPMPSEETGSGAITELSLQRHYSISEIAELWGLDEKTVRRLFASEPGVVELANEETRSKRSYVTRRIPESVLRHVHRRLTRSA
jgi:predicted transcriptional regulator